MSSKKNSDGSVGGKTSLPRSVYALSAAALLFGAIAFAARVDEVGPVVSLADALLLSSVVMLSSASLIYVYRNGGFDIFLYAVSRLPRRRGATERRDYFDFSRRPRSHGKLLSPLFILGGIFLFLSLAVTFLQPAIRVSDIAHSL